MKKLAIGCVVVLALFAAGAAVIGYLAYERLYKPAAQYVSGLKELTALSDLERGVKKRAPFTPPSSGEIDEALVERFVAVQDAMRAAVGTRLREVAAKAGEVDGALKAGGGPEALASALGALKGLGSVLADAKRAQVEALNAAGFSLEEYAWVRDRVYAGLGVVAGRFDVKDLEGMMRSGGAPAARDAGEVPARTRELVARYERKLRELAPLAFFGF